jgi:sugar phosphate isomerase/epimerase
MKLAVSSYSLWNWMKAANRPIDAAIDKIAELGVAGVELAGFDPFRPDPNPLKTAERLRKRAGKSGLAVAGYCVPAELLVPPAARREAVAKIKTHVDVAAALGVASMRHDVTRGFGEWSQGLPGPRTFTAALTVLVPAIREVADYAATRGVRTSLENHGFFMQAAERVERLLKAVKHPNFALTLDMGNFLCVNDDPVASVRRLAKHAVMVHVKDFHIRPKNRMPTSGWFATPTNIALRGAIVGHGQIDVPAQIALLKRSGYNGWLSLEFEGMEDPITAVRLGLDYLRGLNVES